MTNTHFYLLTRDLSSEIFATSQMEATELSAYYLAASALQVAQRP